MLKEEAEKKTIEYLELDEILNAIDAEEDPSLKESMILMETSLSPFQAAQYMLGWCYLNGYNADKDFCFILQDNRRKATAKRRPNSQKWGVIPFQKLSNGRIVYHERELLHWLRRNRHNFTATRKAA